MAVFTSKINPFSRNSTAKSVTSLALHLLLQTVSILTSATVLEQNLAQHLGALGMQCVAVQLCSSWLFWLGTL